MHGPHMRGPTNGEDCLLFERPRAGKEVHPMEDGELLTPVPIWVGLGQFSRGPAESSLWAEPVWGCGASPLKTEQALPSVMTMQLS